VLLDVVFTVLTRRVYSADWEACQNWSWKTHYRNIYPYHIFAIVCIIILSSVIAGREFHTV